MENADTRKRGKTGTSEGKTARGPWIFLKPAPRAAPQLTMLMASMESRWATAHTPKARMVKLAQAYGPKNTRQPLRENTPESSLEVTATQVPTRC